jgi:uncharacterized protein (DUF1800 family)
MSRPTSRRRKRRNRRLPVYQGPFKGRQAERLLWRAGVGPRPGEVREFARLDMEEAIRKLTRPGPEVLVGPEPHRENGQPLAPLDIPTHGQSWWLDRMVRTSRPLVERMTLVWHDWFATSDTEVVVPRLMIEQNELFRARGLGSFAELFEAVSQDPAMLIWQNGNVNRKDAPNENYAREMMELFSLGASRGYNEHDIRELARTLTGWTNRYDSDGKPSEFFFDPALHDPGIKVVFGKRGTFGWQDACRLCVHNPEHASFFVRKLWGYFIPVPPSRRTQRGLERLYRAKAHGIRPVVEAILRHPAFYEGPPMVKPPAIYMAGLHRAKQRGIDTENWAQYGAQCGQRLFRPPNVAGWNDDRWLDSATWLARWQVAERVIRPYPPIGGSARELTAADLVGRALSFWNRPRLLPATRKSLNRFAVAALRDAKGDPLKESTYPAFIEGWLRQLIAVSPEFQVS